jgi:FkbH-like protein
MSPQLPAETRTIVLVADTVVDPLNRFFGDPDDPPYLHPIAAPYAQVHQILLDANHQVWATRPDYALVWTTPTLTLPSFRKLLEYEPAAFDAVVREAEAFAEMIIQSSSRVGLMLVTSWVLPAYDRWIQTLAWKHGVGVANVLARANLLLADKFSSHPNIVLLDLAHWQAATVGDHHDRRMYALGKILYSHALFATAAAEIKAIIRGIQGKTRKVIACDLDNTLWGGIVGDDGLENIRLGAPDPVGESFVELQRALKALKTRGIVLAICSKNDETFALSVIDSHPAMILKRDDFVAWRINWKDKALNLTDLAAELNLGLDSFVLLDDSPHERDQVRRLLPQVYAPDLPASPADYSAFIRSLRCFETATLSTEDYARGAMYRADRNRESTRKTGADVEEWLGSLKIEVRASALNRDTLPRACQLLNKTNQFNLSTRRMDEQAFWLWSAQPDNSVYVFHVNDKFGDFGLTGLATVSNVGNDDVQLTDFVMSCRVMGKKVEEALLAYVVSKMQHSGASRLSAPAIETARNGPALNFFRSKYAAGSASRIDPDLVQCPAFIRLTEES